MQKVLIIKLGYSETLDPGIGKYSSLGDVLRSTVILHCFKDCHVTWLTDESAYPLLEGNPYIHQTLFYDLTTTLQLQREHFDVIVNLEKTPGICALADSIKAWNRYGFRFDEQNGKAESYENSHRSLRTYTDLEAKRKSMRAWQDVLYEMLGRKWNGEKYILGYKPKIFNLASQIGLNHQIGPKWRNKAWPPKYWRELQTLLQGKGYTVSKQQDNDLEGYINWLNSSELIITNDSLGLHLAIALEKKIVALFGPTAPYETYLYELGTKIVSQNDCNIMPCFQHRCSQDDYLSNHCMAQISVEDVLEKTINLLEGQNENSKTT